MAHRANYGEAVARSRHVKIAQKNVKWFRHN